MQNDIVPPPKRPNIKITGRGTMKSQRLRGHSINDAKDRLFGADRPKFSDDKIPTLKLADIDRSPDKMRLHHKIKHHLSKRSKIELVILGVIFAVGVGALSGLIVHYAKGPAQHIVFKQPPKKEPPKPITVASPLSGVQVTPELAARPVTALMIENSLDARPQSGLQDAGVVFEAIAEGGITRFMAVFQDTSPKYVGPVRSLRPYYIDFAAPFQASIGHVGGSPDALSQVRSGSYRDIDQFFNSGSYWRDNNRRAPHNVYTSFERLDGLNQKKGYTSSKYTPWKRKADKALATPTASHISVNISSALYNSVFDYDKTANSYKRSEGGKPQVVTSSAEDRSGVQLSPKVVVALVMSYKVIDGAGHSGYGVTGSGAMYIFQDGGVTLGTWSKTDRSAMFEFKDQAGNPVELNAGQAWVVAAQDANRIASTP